MAHLKSIELRFTASFLKIIVKNNAKPASSSAAAAKESYYQKIGQINESDENVKPQGWDTAKPFNEIPGMKPLPIIGNTWRFFPGGEFHNMEMMDVMNSLQKKYGNITTLNGLVGMKKMVILSDPDDFEHVMRNEGPWPIRKEIDCLAYYRKHVRPDVFEGAEGITVTHGEEWFRQRSVINKVLMQPRTIEMYIDSMNKVANGLVDLIKYLAKRDANSEMPDDFQNELYKWTLESVGVIAYNRRIGCLDPHLKKDSESQKFINAVQEMFDLICKLDLRPSLYKIVSTSDWRKFVRVMNFMTELNKKYISECLAGVVSNPNISDHENSALERVAKVDLKIASVMASDMLGAGVDTTGKSVSSSLYFLAKNPEVQKKLRQELKKVMPNKETPITKEILNNMRYLRAVIKETLRVAPVAFGNSRNTVKDMVIAGYQIPKGTQILMLNGLACSSEKYFSQPDKFIPERWLRNTDNLSEKAVHPFVYLPFGFGPRSCVGKRLANLETEVGIAKIIRNFNVSWNHPDAVFGSRLLYGIISPLKFKMEEIDD